jgi:hypothetical protein
VALFVSYAIQSIFLFYLILFKFHFNQYVTFLDVPIEKWGAKFLQDIDPIGIDYIESTGEFVKENLTEWYLAYLF